MIAPFPYKETRVSTPGDASILVGKRLFPRRDTGISVAGNDRKL